MADYYIHIKTLLPIKNSVKNRLVTSQAVIENCNIFDSEQNGDLPYTFTDFFGNSYIWDTSDW